MPHMPMISAWVADQSIPVVDVGLQKKLQKLLTSTGWGQISCLPGGVVVGVLPPAAFVSLCWLGKLESGALYGSAIHHILLSVIKIPRL